VDVLAMLADVIVYHDEARERGAQGDELKTKTRIELITRVLAVASKCSRQRRRAAG
jgi:hypothetical protein